MSVIITPETLALSRNRIVTELSRSSHGDLKSYLPTGKQAAREDPEFFAHLIAWNEIKGQVRDSKVALPVVYLAAAVAADPVLDENALAHMAMLDPRNLLRAVHFAKESKTHGHFKAVRKMVKGYLRLREGEWGWWERTVLQHRAAMKGLYGMLHIKPSQAAADILFNGKRPKGSVWEALHQLKNMSPSEAAGTILTRKIPYLVAVGALGKKPDSTIGMALISQMSPTELVTNTKMLQKMGMESDPAMRAAYNEALGKAAVSKKSTLKTTRAATAVAAADPGSKTAEKLKGLQERQLNALGGIEGNWAVLGDKSGSMEQAIGLAKEVAGTLARMVKGDVRLVFFNNSAQHYNATGKSLEQIQKDTARVVAGGGTSIGAGLEWLLVNGVDVDGIAIVSDSAENGYPSFVSVYQRYCDKFEKLPPVYLYKTEGEDTNALEGSCARAGVDLQVFDLRRMKLDYYSLPNLVQTMRASKFSLGDEIMDTPLKTLAEVLKVRDRA